MRGWQYESSLQQKSNTDTHFAVNWYDCVAVKKAEKDSPDTLRVTGLLFDDENEKEEED